VYEDILPSDEHVPIFTVMNAPSPANNLALLEYFDKQHKSSGRVTQTSDILAVENLIKPLSKDVKMFKPRQNRFLISVDMEVRLEQHAHTDSIRSVG